MQANRDHLHPDDAPLFDEAYALAIAINRAFALGGLVFEAKRRPHPGGTYGACYDKERRISIVFRFREGKQWWGRPLDRRAILRTVCHEMAHLRYSFHGKVFDAFEAEIVQFANHNGGIPCNL